MRSRQQGALASPRRSRQEEKVFWMVVVLGLLVKFAIHMYVGAGWGFQRDELLYLAQGRHMAWGFWSTPPLTGAVAWVIQQISAGGPGAVHAAAMLASLLTMLLVALMVREMGGGPWAVGLAMAGFLLSPGFLRTGGLFQPVVFEVLIWTVALWIGIRYVRTGSGSWLWAMGAAVGLGLLNKYSMGLFVLALLAAVAATKHRDVFTKPAFWGGAVLALCLWAPNLVWQAQHNYPVITHMGELAATQLGNVTPVGFLLDQVLTYLPGLLIWTAGLVWLFRSSGYPFRVLAWFYVAIVVLMISLSGKSYYTMGAYPALMAAGGVALQRSWVKWPALLFALGFGIALIPFSIPVLPPTEMVTFSARAVEVIGSDAPLRWEDGETYPLPQDYADMLGWPEIGELVDQAAAVAGGPRGLLVYAENYGQAGAIEFYTDLEVISFSDAYLMWARDEVPTGFRGLIYVNHELGDDLEPMYESVELIGRLDNPLARENEVGVWLCLGPKPELAEYYRERVASVKAIYSDLPAD